VAYTLYSEKRTIFHKLHPISKFIMAICATLIITIFTDPLFQAIIFFFGIAMYFGAKFDRKPLSFAFKPLLSLVIIALIMFLPIGSTIAKKNPTFIGPIYQISNYTLGLCIEGILWSITMCFRIFSLVLYVVIVIASTSPAEILPALKKTPLPKIFVYGLALVFRYIPVVLNEFTTVREAQICRLVDFERGNLFERGRKYVSILIPALLVSAVKAERIQMALVSRGFGDLKKRTHYKEISFTRKDQVLTISSIIILILAIIGALFYDIGMAPNVRSPFKP